MAWWGGTFLSAGAISLIFSAFLFPAANWALSQYTPVELFNSIYLSDIFVQLGLTDLFVELVYQLRLSIIIPAALMTVFGFALLLGVFFLSKLSPEQIKHTGNSDLFLKSG